MEEMKGYVDRVIFRNEKNGYAIFDLSTGGKIITCKGTCNEVTQGMCVEVWGDYVEDLRYGTQLKVEKFKSVEPSDGVSIERYLGGGAVKGVGPTLAARIVAKFGEDTFRIMEEEPERLAEIKGISERMAQEIAVQIEEKKDLRGAMVYLQQFGISNALAIKIYDKYGQELYGVMQENPYRLAEDISGVGFRIADEIASKVGIHTNSDYRIRSGLLYVLAQSAGEGHCYLPMELLLKQAAELLGVEEDALRFQMDNLVMEGKLIIRGDHIYTPSFFYAELNCAKMLHELNIPMWGKGSASSREAELLGKLEHISDELHMESDELQLQAVMQSVKNGVFILSGGPGTGKTTTINIMLQYFDSEGLDILLAAPTGRAAKRMTETTGFEARTIHRLLELNSSLSDEDMRKVSFERNEENPLEADVIIIDEMSMVDLHLFQALLKAIVPGTRLILVGDVDQLPSVGPGQVLRDLMDSDCFPMMVLQRIFRQAGESDIVVNAHKINRGEHIAMDNDSKDFFFQKREDENLLYKRMVELVRDKLPGYVDSTSLEIQVLTPMRKGNLGCETLNRILQRYLNPPDFSKCEHVAGENIYREGDKVMQIKNNYQLEWEVIGGYGIVVDKGMGIFNGDMGQILKIDEGESCLVVEYDGHRRVTYPFSMLEELELAYATTIHKSQGSEYPAVILPLLSGPKVLFNRNLLYTAITRAKQCVVILGSEKVVQDMIDNVSEKSRYTALVERIQEMRR